VCPTGTAPTVTGLRQCVRIAVLELAQICLLSPRSKLTAAFRSRALGPLTVTVLRHSARQEGRRYRLRRRCNRQRLYRW
jgi:hypothetical protein